MDEPTSAEAIKGRIAHRHKIFQPILMRTTSGEERVHLLNVSKSGALVHMASPPPAGASVSIRLDTGHIMARIVWSKAPRLGLAFVRVLTESELASLL